MPLHAPSLTVLLAGATLVAAGWQTAQAPRPVFRSGVNLIQLDVSVLDEQRHPVRGLTAGDFILMDGDRVIEVEVVSEIAVPDAKLNARWARSVSRDVVTNEIAGKRLIVIVLDDGRLPSRGSIRARAQAIARGVVDRLGDEDLAAVIFTANNRGAQDFTSDRRLLLDAIARLENGWAGGPPVFAAYSVDVLQRLSVSLSKIPATRKAVVYVSVGHNIYIRPGTSRAANPKRDLFDVAGRVDVLLREAQRANVAVFAIDPRGSEVRATRWNTAAEFLRDLSAHTGGTATVGTDAFEDALDQVFQETGHYYVIGFRPPAGIDAGKFRRLQVKMRRPDLRASTKSGYFVFEDRESAIATGGSAAASQAVAGAVPEIGIPLQLSLLPIGESNSANRTLGRLIVGLRGTAQQVVISQAHAIDFEVRVFDGEGAREIAVARQRAVLGAKPLSMGTVYEIVTGMALKPGRYNVRVGLHDNVAEKTGSVYGTVTVPDYDRDEVSASGVFVEAQSAASIVIGEGLEPRLLPALPTARRLFKSTEDVIAILRLQRRRGTPPEGTVEVRIVDASDREVFVRPVDSLGSLFSEGRTHELRIPLPLRTLPTGLHLLTVNIQTKGMTLTRSMTFQLEP